MKRAKSSREIRRQRIREERKALLEMETTPDEKLRAAIFRNGITLDDLQKQYERGLKEGQRFAEDFAFRTIYAAFLITMIDGRGMGQDEAVELLREIDRQVVTCVEHEELTEEAYEKTGIELNWNDALNRIEERTA